ETKGSKLLAATTFAEPEVEVKLQRDKKADKETETLRLDQFIEVKGWKAMGNKLSYFKVHALTLLTDEGPEPARRETKKRGASPKTEDEAPAAAEPDVPRPVEVTAEEVAQSQALLRRPKAQLGVSIGNRYSDETRKSAYFTAARQYASRALELQPQAGESNYAMALALFSQAGLLSSRDRLRIFKQLRPHVFLAAERRPDMPEAWQLLGRWYYRVAHYNVLEKVFSRVFLGGYPQGASSKKAMEAMEKAHELDPTRIQYSYDLARMYKYQGRRRRAIAVLQEAIKLPTYTSEDLTINRLCQQLLPPLVRAASRRDRVHARWYER
nr:hypothetical protein [Tanacetum cinerariifolium]